MKQKNEFPMLLALAVVFACAPVAAHAAQHQDVPPQPPQANQPAPPQPNPADQRDAQRTVSGPYRLTYTLTEMDGSKRMGSQRYAIVLDAGSEVPPATLRLGSKIPIVTGELQGGSASQTISYIDIGMNFQALLRRFANGLELRSHVIQSAVDSQQSLTKQPVIRQTDLESSVLLKENQPITLGTMDMLGSTHVLQIEVELTKIP